MWNLPPLDWIIFVRKEYVSVGATFLRGTDTLKLFGSCSAGRFQFCFSLCCGLLCSTKPKPGLLVSLLRMLLRLSSVQTKDNWLQLLGIPFHTRTNPNQSGRIMHTSKTILPAKQSQATPNASTWATAREGGSSVPTFSAHLRPHRSDSSVPTFSDSCAPTDSFANT